MIPFVPKKLILADALFLKICTFSILKACVGFKSPCVAEEPLGILPAIVFHDIGEPTVERVSFVVKNNLSVFMEFNIPFSDKGSTFNEYAAASSGISFSDRFNIVPKLKFRISFSCLGTFLLIYPVYIVVN